MGADGLEWNSVVYLCHSLSESVNQKTFYTIILLTFSAKHMLHVVSSGFETPMTQAQLMKSLNSHPLDEGVYEDDSRIHYFPTYVSSFMDLHIHHLVAPVGIPDVSAEGALHVSGSFI